MFRPQSKNMKYRVFEYGSYANDEYMRALKETKFVLWIGTHESQGFAFQDCLASNVPILVWDATSMFDEWNAYEKFRGQKNLYATTATQWSSACGERIITAEELGNTVTNILTNIHKYTPRDYILSRVSDSIAIKRIFESFVSTPNFKGRVTILGSCRQHSLKDYYDITSIQERLTYPHYTKEIIQTIEYCKGISKFDNKFTKYAFRTGILDKKEILYQKELQQEFESTDLFVVEIASRISYGWNSLYVHHILAEEEYGFHDISNINQRDLSDEEIESDILKIKEYLFPKKIIIVSHVATRKSGKRYELVKLLERICFKHAIPFINPAQELSNAPNLYENDTAFHYTQRGHEEICKVYNRHIETVFNKKTAILVWKSSFFNNPRTRTNCYWGIGDMLRGVIGVYKLSKKYNFDLILDNSLHPLSMLLKSDTHRYTEHIKAIQDTIPLYMPDDVEGLLVEKLVNSLTNEPLCFYSNMPLSSYDGIMTEDLKQFIEYVMKPMPAFEEYTNSKLSELKLKEYTILHYRLGDDELVLDGRNSISYDNVYTHLLKNYKETDVVITDSKYFKTMIRERGSQIRVLDTKICHLGFEDSYESLQDTLFEFNLLRGAKQIRSFSTYGWISGFVFAVHKIFGTPLEGYSNVRF